VLVDIQEVIKEKEKEEEKEVNLSTGI